MAIALRFRELLVRERPLLLPVAHDALSARMIERAGFAAMAVGGVGIVGCRLGLPDLGLASFGEMSAAVRDLRAATALPLVVDADDGYGDVKNVTRTVRAYEAMGVTALVLQDGAGSMVTAERKLAAALGARRDPYTAIVARTGVRGGEGLDAAIGRGRRYAALGVDALLVDGPATIEELRAVGDAFDLPLMVNATEGRLAPPLPPEEYRSLGFSIVLYPSSLLLRMVHLFAETLTALKAGRIPADAMSSIPDFIEIVGTGDWLAIDALFGDPAREAP